MFRFSKINIDPQIRMKSKKNSPCQTAEGKSNR
jgi:hypothetical protein